METSTSGQRFLIERPRLMSAIETSTARVILLVAPAGYGKTTVIRQWLANGEHQASWYRANAASADVAALATGIARAATRVLAGVDDVVRRHLKSLSKPSEHAEELGHTIASALADWPSDTWLVLDDYEFVTESQAAERFVEVLLESSPVRIAVAARRVPRWMSARRLLYGEIFEISQGQLALTQEETGEVLYGRASEAAAIWARTKGWPSVIRLAALTGNLALPEDALPPALHQYFAEELLQAASTSAREGLVKLAALPTLDTHLINLALGAKAESVCKEGVELGLLSRDPAGLLELHPLLRTFLDTKLRDADQGFLSVLIEGVIAEKRWDDAFDMITRSARFELLPSLFDSALDPLLEERRVATLEHWVSFAIRTGCEFPLLLLAEAEIFRRLGRFDTGEARALQSASALGGTSTRWLSRANVLAGECAHHDYRFVDAIDHLRRAEEYASATTDRRRAVWGQFVSTVQTGDLGARELLERFQALSDGRAATTLRIASGRMMLATLEGGIETRLRREEKHLDLVKRVDDPLATTSFLYRVAYTKVATGHYVEGLEIAKQGDEVARRERLPFAIGHIAAAMAAATLGLRQLKRAELLIQRLDVAARELDDSFELANALALRARLHLARGLLPQAASTLQRWEKAPTTAMQGECASLRAIALAAHGELEAAHELAAFAEQLTREVQSATLARMATAIVALADEHGEVEKSLRAVEDVLIERQNYDSLVCAYRAFPPLLAALRRRGKLSEGRLASLVRDSRDLRLAASLNWELQAATVSTPLLSPRERQVYELLSRGLTNREIARDLFIAEVTVKVHVRHIFDKLGVRSRTEAALLYYEPA